MIKTGIFGGSFDPIHKGHIALARTILQKMGLEEVWFVVSPHNPLKEQQNLTDDNVRLEMVRLALSDYSRLVASDYEFYLPRPSYMWNTLVHIQADFPDRKLFLIIGEDNWDCFDQWYHHEDILKNFNVIVYPRNAEQTITRRSNKQVRFIRTRLLPVSSTMVRERVRKGEPINDLVPSKIVDFIEKNHLYQQ